jgi:hypothetical protein
MYIKTTRGAAVAAAEPEPGPVLAFGVVTRAVRAPFFQPEKKRFLLRLQWSLCIGPRGGDRARLQDLNSFLPPSLFRLRHQAHRPDWGIHVIPARRSRLPRL